MLVQSRHCLMVKLICFLGFCLAYFQSVAALECYVCTNQQANQEKCLNTIKTCEQEEDRCLSEIKWGTPPYWSRGNAKQYYVSKRCATKETCKRTISKYMPFCHYINYYDWMCAECCAGDRCNYYVTLVGSTITSNTSLICLTVLVAMASFFKL